MTSLPLVRTEYLNTSTNTVRTGATSHGESLTDMESYLLRHDQITATTLHSWGVAEGLTVTGTPNPTSLTITPGVALDSAGHLIALAADGFAITDPTVDPTQIANIPTVPVTADGVVLTTTSLTGDRYLTITWREVLDPSSTGTAPTLIHAPWLRLQLVTDVPDTGEQIVLAHVVLGAQSQITTLTADHRRLIGVPAGRLELRRPRTSVGPPATADQLPAGELRATDDGGVALNLVAADGTTRPVLQADPAGNLALQPDSGSVGIGLRGTPPSRTVHVEGTEIHSGGPGGGFSFASRTIGNFVATPAAGERWVWYAANGVARLWSGGDRLSITLNAGGVRLGAGAQGSSTELGAVGGGSLGKLVLTAGNIVARRSDNTEPILLDTVNGRIGQGTTNPTHPLHITGYSGIRQNYLYLTGGPGWSSLSYNAFHDAANQTWVFPDPNRTAVTVEMDDTNTTAPRFQVWTTTNDNKQSWQMRLGIDGNTGTVAIPGALSLGNTLSVAGTASVAGMLSLTTGMSSSGAVNISADNSIGALQLSNSGGAALCIINSDNRFTAATISSNGTGLAVSGSTAANLDGNVYVTGDVHVTGTLTASGKSFLIDHPCDSQNRTLAHASVESCEQTVMYSGNVKCDVDGNATVPLPDWLEALATDFRYQLTCVGGQSNVYISEEVRDNSFRIAGGTPGQRVSWQLTGVRQDAWAKTHELVVEDDKPEDERGFYLNPEAFGRDMTASVHWVRHEELRKQHPILAQRIVNRHAEQETTRLRAQTERTAAATSGSSDGPAKKRSRGKVAKPATEKEDG